MKRTGKLKLAGGALTILAFSVLAALSGCGEKKPEGPSLNAAIVADADFTVRVDVAGARGSEIGKMLEEIQAAEGSDAPLPAAVPESETLNKLMEATGLEKDDLKDILITAAVGEIDPESLESEEELLKVSGVLAFGLMKPLSREQMKAGLDVLSAEEGEFKVSEATVGAESVFKLSSSQPDQPEIFCAPSADGKAVFFSLNESSLQGALERAKSGAFNDFSPGLAAIDQHLAPGSQVRWASLLSEMQRREIGAKVDELEEKAKTEPGTAGMIVGFVKPFRDIRSLALGILLTKDVGITLTSDLGGEEQALQASTVIQTMLLPLAKSALAQQAGSQASPAADSLKVESSASNLKITMTLTEEDIRSGLEKKKAKHAAAGEGAQSAGGVPPAGDL